MTIAIGEVLPVRANGIPRELRVRPQWVVWRLEDRGSGPTKVPYSPRTGARARSTDLMTWGAFEEAHKAYEAGDCAGVGFMFSSGDPYAGVDLDGCRDPETGELEAWAAEIVDALDSYTEASPSGSGVHVIVRGKIPAPLKRERIEMYHAERYFTVTGHVLERGA